jgi:Co/Zn/Cd efflux system component
MMLLGLLALGASLTCSAIVLRQRNAASTLAAVWKLSTSDAVSNVAVVAAGAMVALTLSNIPDLVIGGAMAGYFALKGWRVMISGRIVDPRSP